MSIPADWIAVDWGTSNVRAWAMGRDGAVLTSAQSDRGMTRLSGAAAYEAVLLDLVAGWVDRGRPTPVVICGMAGARQGWIEAPYASVPCAPVDSARVVKAPMSDPVLDVTIVHGLSQAEPADVMRGEETQLAGLLSLRPDTAVVCLPGTHTKWVRLESGVVRAFATAMTGELFDLLSAQSVLRHSVWEAGWDDAAFDEAVSEMLADPGALAARLFSIRAGSLLHGLNPEQARARLSGLLIGQELAVTRRWWQGTTVSVVGSDAVAGTYARALRMQDVEALIFSAEEITLAGLIAAHAALARKPVA